MFPFGVSFQELAVVAVALGVAGGAHASSSERA